MTYGVVVCPRCNHVKAADLQFKTTKCLECGKSLDLASTKIWASTDDNLEVAQLVCKVKAKMHGVEIEPEQKKKKPGPKPPRKPGSKRERLLMDIALALTRENGTFTLSDFSEAVAQAVKDVSPEEIEQSLEFLQARGVVIEPRQGTYRAVEENL